ncbi:hypothetical protein OA92_07635 [Marinomonas sp. SBI22]|uniref:MarR family winged helix-turn-helix transcriptional regulator n=1 Tax=unclassified Marinomonas TaxID=196814 RepID=UPI0007AF4DFF|nr:MULTISPECIES: MarR family transcriptional regulator [unclassified Marinomonas]KZM40474.1 hypothetical protein OA91_19835 [Marinomonas sp. SBI8L]KZM43565.1 hypothetical protein OA92_07635 [Marinomonas sp. SBI22]
MSKEAPKTKLPRHTSFGWLIAVLGGQMANGLDTRLKEIGLHIGLWPTLFALWEEEGLTQTELAHRCQTAHYTTTRVLDSLEKLELVERRAHPTSRRAFQIFLTEKGRSLEVEGTSRANECNQEFLSALTPEESDELHRLVAKVIKQG